MAALRTEITEIVTGLAMLGYRDLDEALDVRPRSVVNLADEHYERLAAARVAESHTHEFETAWENGRVFARSEDGLRGRPPWTVEWKGPHKPPGYEQVPADLRVDHVYLISCKYGSSILHNAGPSHVFQRRLAEKRVDRGPDWFEVSAPDAYQEFYRSYVRSLGLVGLPDRVGDLDRHGRTILKAALPKRAKLPAEVQQYYEAFSIAVSQASAEQWNESVTSARHREDLVWRLLRLQAAPYFVLGATTQRAPLRYRVGTPWDFRHRFEVTGFVAWPEVAGQPLVKWRVEVADRDTREITAIDGHVEVRWTHGRFSGAPEAKVHLDSAPHDVPGYFPLQ